MTPETEPGDSGQPIGENLDTDMRRPVARFANKLLMIIGKDSDNTVIDLGEQHGEVNIRNVRFRDALEKGKLTVYIRQEAVEHPVITSVVAIGVVAAGIRHLKHRKK